MNVTIVSRVIVIIMILLYLSGDVEKNPRPSSSCEDMDYEDPFENFRFQDLVTFTCINIQSVLPKLDLLEAELGDRDIILLTETWLKNSVLNKSVEITNFKEPFRYDRSSDKNGGGVMIYVKNNIPCNCREDLEVTTVECLWVELYVKKIKILFGLFYRPPDSPSYIWDHINQSLQKALCSGIDKVIVVGDFNENQLNTNLNKLRNITSQNGLFQIISEPTFYCETSSSLLDPIIVSDKELLVYHEVGENIPEANVRYHCPVSVIINLQKTCNKSFKRKIWDFKNGDYAQYREDLRNIEWDSLINQNHLNAAVSAVTQTILDVAAKNIPCKYVQVRTQDPPWMNSFIRKLIRKRKRLHKKTKKVNSEESWQKFRKTRNECVNLIKNAKSENLEKQINTLKSTSLSVKQWWKTLRSLSGLPTKLPPSFD